MNEWCTQVGLQNHHEDYFLTFWDEYSSKIKLILLIIHNRQYIFQWHHIWFDISQYFLFIHLSKKMILFILLTSILSIQAKSCASTPITCESILYRDLCQSVEDYNYNSLCEWDDYSYKC